MLSWNVNAEYSSPLPTYWDVPVSVGESPKWILTVQNMAQNQEEYPSASERKAPL
jgi:hypothetical protein